MFINVNRIKSDKESTLSIITVDDVFVCFGLEDEERKNKIIGETRIPTGRYDVGVKNHGGFHQKYAVRYGDMHQGMLQVLDVPNFTDILIHVGNTEKDTMGCLLVGEDAVSSQFPMRVNASVMAYKKLYPMVIQAAMRRELAIRYIDND